MLPLVAIIGKPNVGKSTLFNRFVGYRKAVVSATPGTTRDRHYAQIDASKPYLLIDTGGIESKTEGIIEENILAQAKMAIEEASVIVFLIDAKQPLTREDHHAAELLRKSKKPIILVASKSDSGQEDLSELYSLGFGDPIRVSATHKIGVGTLEDAIKKIIPRVRIKAQEQPEQTRLAMLGRPNVGKSSMINKLLGSEKLIVSEVQGTTIDSTDIDLEYKGKHFVLVDTAGIRRRGKIGKGIEKYSFLRSLGSSDRADVCALMVDGLEGVTSQDQHVADYILQRYSGLILVVNKIDLMEKGEEERESFLRRLHSKFEFVPWAPVVFVSAKTGKHVEKILELAEQIKDNRARRIETGQLNRWLERVVMKHMPTGTGRKMPKLYYISQVDVNPPHFVLFCNREEYFHFSYLRYLENQLRESFDFTGTAIKMEYREKQERKSIKRRTIPKKNR
ncbi:MAG: ribosome biogenesis GTPase Der [bacterium]|nr:ribosome biogenesis GTPase Der [bacterium]